MKRILGLIFCAMLLVTFCGCGSNNNVEVAIDSKTRYEVVSAPVDNGPMVVESVTDNEFNYYLLDLGYAKDVPLSSGIALEYIKGGTSISVTLTKTEVTERSVSSSIARAISQTISDSVSGNAEVSISQELNVGVKVEGVVEVGGSQSFVKSYGRSWGTTVDNANSTSNTFTSVSSTAEQLSTSVSYTIGEKGEPTGSYRLSLVATCDIYAFIKTSLDNQSLLEISYTYSPRNDMRLRLEFDADHLFDAYAKNKITLHDEYYKNLPRPTKVVDEVYILEPEKQKEININYSELTNFESGSYEGWQCVGVDGHELFVHGNAYSGEYSIKLFSSGSGIAKEYEIKGPATIRITYQACSHAAWTQYTCAFYSVDGGVTWEKAGNDILYGEHWKECSYTIPNISSSVMIRISKTSEHNISFMDGDLFVDDIGVSVAYYN